MSKNHENGEAFLLACGFTKDSAVFFRKAPHVFFANNTHWVQLCNADNPMEAFPALIPAFTQDYIDSLHSEMYERHLPDYNNPELFEQIRVGQDLADWLQTPVRLNIGLLVDAFSCYELNNTYPAYGSEDFDEEYRGQFHRSSIMWLTRRQGYTQRQLRQAQYHVKEACKADDPLQIIPSRFLYSAAMEIGHELCDTNQLGFFICITVKELLILLAAKQFGKKRNKWSGYLLLDTKTSCGFFSTQRGSCSLLGIELEKPVKLPLDSVELFPDGAENYALFKVHGKPSVWRSDCILHYGFPRQFRHNEKLQ